MHILIYEWHIKSMPYGVLVHCEMLLAVTLLDADKARALSHVSNKHA